jgi:hypothetical protein
MKEGEKNQVRKRRKGENEKKGIGNDTISGTRTKFYF